MVTPTTRLQSKRRLPKGVYARFVYADSRGQKPYEALFDSTEGESLVGKSISPDGFTAKLTGLGKLTIGAKTLPVMDGQKASHDLRSLLATPTPAAPPAKPLTQARADAPEPMWVPAQVAAERLGVDRSYVLALVRDGRLKPKAEPRRGTMTEISVQSLRDFEASRIKRGENLAKPARAESDSKPAKPVEATPTPTAAPKPVTKPQDAPRAKLEPEPVADDAIEALIYHLGQLDAAIACTLGTSGTVGKKALAGLRESLEVMVGPLPGGKQP